MLGEGQTERSPPQTLSGLPGLRSWGLIPFLHAVSHFYPSPRLCPSPRIGLSLPLPLAQLRRLRLTGGCGSLRVGHTAWHGNARNGIRPHKSSPRRFLMSSLLSVGCLLPSDAEEVQVRGLAWGRKSGSTSALLYTSDCFPHYGECVCTRAHVRVSAYFRQKQFCFAVIKKFKHQLLALPGL